MKKEEMCYQWHLRTGVETAVARNPILQALDPRRVKNPWARGRQTCSLIYKPRCLSEVFVLDLEGGKFMSWNLFFCWITHHSQSSSIRCKAVLINPIALDIVACEQMMVCKQRAVNMVDGEGCLGGDWDGGGCSCNSYLINYSLWFNTNARFQLL